MADRSRNIHRDDITQRHGTRRGTSGGLCRDSQRGFSIIELLLVVLIIGLISSIMIPNLIDAIHKAKQRRTMAELQMVGGAWMSWLTDQAGASAAGAQQTYNLVGFNKLSYVQVYGYLHPSDTFFYMQAIPAVDAWGSQLDYYQNSNPLVDNQLLLCAAARDNAFETCTEGASGIPIGPFLATDFDQDIVWADGYMVRWPDIRAGVN